jgi:hypothetical protein
MVTMEPCYFPLLEKFRKAAIKGRCIGTEVHILASQPLPSGGFARERVSGLPIDESHPRAQLFAGVGGLCDASSISSGGGSVTPSGKCKTYRSTWTRTSGGLTTDGNPSCNAEKWLETFESSGAPYLNTAVCGVIFNRDYLGHDATTMQPRCKQGETTVEVYIPLVRMEKMAPKQLLATIRAAIFRDLQ